MKNSIILFYFVLVNINQIYSLIWNGNFAEFSTWNIIKSYLEQNRQIVNDPKGGTTKVLQVKYPNGTWSDMSIGRKGGTGFFVYPFGSLTNVEHATFEYDLYLPPNFDYVKGGKLPGLYGGRTDCSGGSLALDCFSTRLMFGPNGGGYGYLYVSKQAIHSPEFCAMVSAPNCAPDYGYGIGGGSYFVRDKWMRIKTEIKLNTIGQQNGRFAIWVDSNLKFEFNKMVYRTTLVKIGGIAFETFYGGSTPDWATKKDEYSYFRNMRIETF